TAADDTVSDVAADVHTVAVAGSITGDGAVAGVAQVTANADTATVSTVTVHRGVGQGTVAADVHTGAIAGGTAADDTVSDVAADVHTVAAAGGITRDVTSCHRTINVNTRSVTGGIARDSAVAAAGQVAGDIHTTTVSTVTVHRGVEIGRASCREGV